MSRIILAAALTLAASNAMASGEAFYSSSMSQALPLAQPAVIMPWEPRAIGGDLPPSYGFSEQRRVHGSKREG